MEEIPNDLTNGGTIDLPWQQDEIFSHLACLYIKYIDIYAKLEDCYD